MEVVFPLAVMFTVIVLVVIPSAGFELVHAPGW